MKYYLIVGEASGDLHASNLMHALKEVDPQATFRCFGGDRMAAEGATVVRHYRDMAYMGFVQVALHARTLLAGIRQCREDIVRWSPDVLVLVDYPGFNLKIAHFVRAHTRIPIYYYISPKIWAWKTWRIKALQRDVDEMFSILPFEVPFYDRYRYPIHYVGNPCADAVAAYQCQPVSRESFVADNHLPDKPIIALLAGSRKAEISDNLPHMLDGMRAFPGYMPVIAGAPGIDEDFYRPFMDRARDQGVDVAIVFGQTYALLNHARAALVTSGTATLETALLRVPQVVCYYIRCGRLVSVLRRWVLKVPYISLVNLIAGHEAVSELVAHHMNSTEICRQLEPLLSDTPQRAAQLSAYDAIIATLGGAGCSARAAKQMVACLQASCHPTDGQIDNHGGHSQQHAVDTVQDTAVSGE